MNDREFKKEFNRRQRLQQLEAMEANESRAQSIAVGTAGGGSVDITMRGTTGKFLWNVYQPVEVIELINQLAAGIGCHIQIVPRQDFASWRDWKVTPEELERFRGVQPFQGVGHAPHSKIDVQAFKEIGGNLPHSNEQAGLPKPKIRVETEKENVATKKAVNKRSTKRSWTSTK